MMILQRHQHDVCTAIDSITPGSGSNGWTIGVWISMMWQDLSFDVSVVWCAKAGQW